MKRTMFTLGGVLLAVVIGFGQEPERAKAEALQKRISELESQVKLFMQELVALKASVADSKPAEPISKPTDAKPDAAKEPARPKSDLGIDVGSARIVPYGTLFFNAFGNSGGTNNADVPLWAATNGNSNLSATARQTRLGLRLEGARVGNTKVGAVLEADFYGGTPAVGIGENFGVVRLRLANVRLERERTSITLGQDWMVFAPQNPTSLAAAAIPQMASAGNNWARLPQVKVQQKFASGITWQAAILAPQTGDSAATASFLLQPNSGASSRVPFLQSRISYDAGNWFGSGRAGTLAVSGHYGRSRISSSATTSDIDSAGLALDWSVPLSARVVLVGEAFTGKNLGGFQAGIFQSYNADFARPAGSTLVAGGVRPIGTRGGWTQLGFTPDVAGDRLGLYASVGLDDPRDADLVSLTSRDWRTRNLAYAFNAIYKFTPQFSVGGEFRRFHTTYVLTGIRRASHVNFAASLSF